MPRPLSASMEAIMLSATTRSPAWKVEIYDVRSTTDTINLVVRNNLLGDVAFQTLTGPQDFTGYTESVTVNEERGDYVQGGIAPTDITVALVDPDGLLDPLRIVGLSTSSAEYEAELGRYLRKGNVVVVYVGDSRVPESEWVRVFTGKINGQPGRSRSRVTGRSVMQFKAVSREYGFNQYERTSDPFSIGTTFLQAANTIAQTEMGLDVVEIALSGWGAHIVAHEPVQFVDEPPLGMLAKLMFADGFLPRFNGSGQLTQISSTITATADRLYQDLSTIRQINRPYSEVEQPNCVTVVGLDANMARIVQPEQRLATTDITTGYFANGEEITVLWADDRTTVAVNVQAQVLKSVNGGLSLLGGGETFTPIPATTPGGGTGYGDETVGMVVTVDTGFAPWIVVFLLVTYVVLAAIPDEVNAVVAGYTIPVGRIAQATALSSALYVMTKIGRGQYEFVGAPVEYVYPEIRKRACVAGQTFDERNTIEIENHLLNTESACTNAARDTLLLLQAQENPREVEMLHDLRLEPDDIFQLDQTSQRYLVQSVRYTLTRDPANGVTAQVSAFEITSGVLA